MGFFSSSEFIVNIINNIIGIIPPILIFDFFNEKLSKDSSAIEMSSKITETLMANPETLDLFTEEQRNNFLGATVESIVKDPDVTEMINSNIKTYLTGEMNYQIRTEFNYNFELREHLPNVFDAFPQKDSYFYVQEKLFYKVKNMSVRKGNTIEREFYIGFIYDNQELDNALREKQSEEVPYNCLFRESLDIDQEGIQYFSQLDSDQLDLQFQKMFKLDVQIDNLQARLLSIEVKERGIFAKFRSEHSLEVSNHAVRVIFHMPKKWNSILEVALVDPTKEPKVSVSYPEDVMKVEVFSFLNKGEETRTEVAHEHKNGIYDISLNDQWIYPISGIIFCVDRVNG